MQTKLSTFSEEVIEAGWLVALIIVPLFFNIYSQRVFEPDKLSLFRSVALFMVIAWMISFIDSHAGGYNPEVQKGRIERRIHRTILWQSLFRTPFVLPILALAGTYLLSTIFSVAPRISLWGSYNRLQGTFTMFSFLILFFFIFGKMRREEQLNRFWSILILISLPISFYGLLQHFHLDPVPWSDEKAMSVPRRVVSTMGNPIFLGAYLIMIIPITLARIIEIFSLPFDHYHRPTSHVFLTVFYISIFGLQILCLLFTQSRGPWLGLMGGLYFFIFFILLSLRRKDEEQSRLNGREIIKALVFTVISIMVGVIPAYLLLILLKRGLRWLWISWMFHTLLIGGILILLVLPHSPFSSFQKIPYLERLIQLSHTETGTVKVRMLIWKGIIELVENDPVRLIIGHGPEALQAIFHRYYTPELAHYASRTTQVDRSHNETFDVLVTTGIIGLGVYLFLIGSILHFGFKWLGFIRTKRNCSLLHFLMAMGGITGVFLPRWIEGSYRLSGVGLPFGIIFGAILYLIFSETIFYLKEQKPIDLKRPWLFIGIFSAIVAHLIELQFGIAIAVTQFYFWIYLAVFVLMGLNWIRETSGEEKAEFLPPPRYSSSCRLSGILAGSFLTAAVLFTLGFDFINNTTLEQSGLKIIQISLTTLGPPGSFKPSYGLLCMFLITWLIGGFLVVAETRYPALSTKKMKNWFKSLAIYTLLTIMVFIIGMVIYFFMIKPDKNFSNTITFYYIGMGIITLLISSSLFLNRTSPKRVCWKGALWVYPILMILIFVVIFSSNMSIVKADIYFKQGLMLKDKKRWDECIQLYRRAISLAPDQDYYYIELGRVIMEKAILTNDYRERSQLFEESLKSLDYSRKLNPLLPDSYIYVGHLFHRWAEVSPSPEERNKRFGQSHQFYQKAVERAPFNAQIFNLWAQTYLSQVNYESALEKLYISLSIDSKFGSTYVDLGDLYFTQGKFAEAENAYWQAIILDPNHAKAHSALGYLYYQKGNFIDALELNKEAIRIDPNQTTAHSVLGLIYFKSGQMEQAMEENLKVLQISPNDFSSHKNLALIYQKMGHLDIAFVHAQKALELSPEKDRPALQKFIDQLKGQKRTGQGKL